jgi:hypothetical protein
MVMHQHPKVLSTRMINKSKARKIVCEQKGWLVNWVVFGEWTIKEQLKRINLLLERGQCEKTCLEGVRSLNKQV